jgi:hypothetical protein
VPAAALAPLTAPCRAAVASRMRSCRVLYVGQLEARLPNSGKTLGRGRPLKFQGSPLCARSFQKFVVGAGALFSTSHATPRLGWASRDENTC